MLLNILIKSYYPAVRYLRKKHIQHKKVKYVGEMNLTRWSIFHIVLQIHTEL